MSVTYGNFTVNNFSALVKQTNGVFFGNKHTSTNGNAYYLDAEFFNSPTIIAQNLGDTLTEDLFTLKPLYLGFNIVKRLRKIIFGGKFYKLKITIKTKRGTKLAFVDSPQIALNCASDSFLVSISSNKPFSICSATFIFEKEKKTV